MQYEASAELEMRSMHRIAIVLLSIQLVACAHSSTVEEQVCPEGWADCNGAEQVGKTGQAPNRQEDGCEVDLHSSASNCGRCGAPCFGACRAGVCELVELGRGRFPVLSEQGRRLAFVTREDGNTHLRVFEATASADAGYHAVFDETIPEDTKVVQPVLSDEGSWLVYATFASARLDSSSFVHWRNLDDGREETLDAGRFNLGNDLSLSSDGSVIAWSTKRALEPNDLDSSTDLYTFDREAKRLSRIDKQSFGEDALVGEWARLSGDGDTLVFRAESKQLQNPSLVFSHLPTTTNTAYSTWAESPSLSQDASYVAFEQHTDVSVEDTVSVMSRPTGNSHGVCSLALPLELQPRCSNPIMSRDASRLAFQVKLSGGTAESSLWRCAIGVHDRIAGQTFLLEETKLSSQDCTSSSWGCLRRSEDSA
jgi:Tol biopolymer transport system component